MSIFYDDTGRDWEILITPRTMFRLKQLTQGHRDIDGEIIFVEPLDLANAATNNALSQLVDVYPRAIAVYLLCKKQAEQRGVSEGEFLDAMLKEESLAGMTDALFAAIEESFPNVKMRETARKIREGEGTRAKIVTSVYDKILTRIGSVADAPPEDEIEKIVETAWSMMPGRSSGNASESVA